MENSDYKILLEISQAIASVREKDDLLRLILERVKSLFGFYDVGIFVLDASGEYHRDLSVAHPSIAPSSVAAESLFAAGLSGWLLHKDSPIEHDIKLCEEAGAPLVFKFDEMMRDFPDYPFQKVMENLGYQDFLATVLRVRGETTGILYFNSLEADFFQPARFSLFQSIADQIAVAVANILANEEILEREREKSKLLSISREIAKVQTREQLLGVIFNTVKSIFPYDDAGLFYFCDADGRPNPQGDCHVFLLDDMTEKSRLVADNATIAGRVGNPYGKKRASRAAPAMSLMLPNERG